MNRKRLLGSCCFCVTLCLGCFATGTWAQNQFDNLYFISQSSPEMAQNENHFLSGTESLFFFSQYWMQSPDNETSFHLDLYRDGILDERDLLQFIADWQHRRHLDQEIVINLPGLPEGAIPLTLVRIPAGSFMMGSPEEEDGREINESPQHPVNIGHDFYMGKYAVTKAQWQAVMGTTPWAGKSYVLNDPNSPAVHISWNSSRAFIQALNQLGQGTFRLPSEAEWEYACRAGTTTRFYWGNDFDYTQIGNHAWYSVNREGQYAHVVGQKLPNAWGLYDMSGNVDEWCEDDWHDNYHEAPTDGSVWVDSPRGSYRMARGGSWYYTAWRCRSANRFGDGPNDGRSNLGFRVAGTP